jgi:hypothetical protein
LKLSSYYNNNARKSFDFTMNRFYDMLENDSYASPKINFRAKIVSGNETGDTTSLAMRFLNNFFGSNAPKFYKIRFIEEDVAHNLGLNDPDFIEDPQERNEALYLHPEAFLEIDSFLDSIPIPGAIVLVSDVNFDGVYKIEKILQESTNFEDDSVLRPSAEDSFVGGVSSFLGNLLDTSPGDWNKGSGVVFRNSEEEERATQFLNELSKKAVPLGIPVYVNSAYRDPKSQARVVAGNTVRENGKNLVVYNAETKRIYLRLAARAHQDPTGPEMKELVEYETKKLAAALKRDPNYQGHGTGYSFDLSIYKLNQSKLSTYRSLIEDLGASVLYETHPPHYHINLRTWKPKDKTVVEKGYDALDKLTKMFKEEPEE